MPVSVAVTYWLPLVATLVVCVWLTSLSIEETLVLSFSESTKNAKERETR
ncbi:MAG TPA: hypothetical protein PK867_24670 [Pirellulales bacterium]|nr:hypothetical protein [Pirellulales bacterium]